MCRYSIRPIPAPVEIQIAGAIRNYSNMNSHEIFIDRQS